MYLDCQVEIPEIKTGVERSNCLKIGTFLVVRKIMEEYNLPHMITRQLGAKDAELFLDLAIYSISAEGNAAQHYPAYAYNHPLFTEKVHIYSDSKISDFLTSVSDDARIGFLNEWNEKRDHREKIYISYGSCGNSNTKDNTGSV